MGKKERNELLKKRPLESRAVIKARAARYADVARAVMGGLKGKPFAWRGCDNHLIFIAEGMGLTLISEGRAREIGLVLKRGQEPVGNVYYEAPISKYVDVYVLECQFNRKKTDF